MKYLFITTGSLITLFRNMQLTVEDLAQSIFLIDLPYAEVVARLKPHIPATKQPILAGVSFASEDQWYDLVAALFTAKFEGRFIWGAPPTVDTLNRLLMEQELKPLPLPNKIVLTPDVARERLTCHGFSLTVV